MILGHRGKELLQGAILRPILRFHSIRVMAKFYLNLAREGLWDLIQRCVADEGVDTSNSLEVWIVANEHVTVGCLPHIGLDCDSRLATSFEGLQRVLWVLD